MYMHTYNIDTHTTCAHVHELPFMHVIVFFFVIYIIVEHCSVQQTRNGSISQSFCYHFGNLRNAKSEAEHVKSQHTAIFTLHGAMFHTGGT